MKKLLFIFFVLASFYFVVPVSADYDATVINPEGARCSLRTDSTGYCYYSDATLSTVTQRVLWLDTNDSVKVLTEYQTVTSPDTSICSDYYVYTAYTSKTGDTYNGYYCHANLQSGSLLTDELRQKFINAGFPSSYFEKLAILQTVHPNWVFKAVNTGLDFNTAVRAESAIGTSLIHISYSGNTGYLSTEPIAYNHETDTFKAYDGSTWYAANSNTVAYYMDPRNFLNDMTIFQFEALSYDNTIQTKEIVTSLLGTNFLNAYIDYFMDAANYSSVSPVYLASLSKQEVGGANTPGVAINGEGFTYCTNNTKYPQHRGVSFAGGYFNFYNIGATGDPCAAQNGLIFARGENEEFLLPWTTVGEQNGIYRSIVGGAKYIGSYYINQGQDTIYFKKFNVIYNYLVNTGRVPSYNNYAHQYQTNIMAPSTEATSTYRSYYNSGVINSPFVFYIPVYDNIDSVSTSLPNQGNPNNYLSSLKVNDTLLEGYDMDKDTYNLYVEYNVNSINVSSSTVNSYASVSGNGAHELKVGVNNIVVTVTAQNGDKRTYTIVVTRSEDTSGQPSLTDVVNGLGIKSDGTYFSGIPFETNISVLTDKIKSLNPVALVEIKDNNGSVKSGIFATGDTVTITSAGETKTYNIVIYGDTSGDGRANVLDLLITQKHILGINTLNGSFAKAADVSRDGNINVLDLLVTQKHILGLTAIEQ